LAMPRRRRNREGNSSEGAPRGDSSGGRGRGAERHRKGSLHLGLDRTGSIGTVSVAVARSAVMIAVGAIGYILLGAQTDLEINTEALTGDP
jgi:hypothetical protein